MSATNTIYSNIVDVSKMDNIGLVVSWTGTPTGSITYYASNSGASGEFSALTFGSAPGNPSGTTGIYNLNFQQFPYKYLYVKYINASGSGLLTITAQNKDLN